MIFENLKLGYFYQDFYHFKESEAALSESAVFPAQLIIIEVANIATNK